MCVARAPNLVRRPCSLHLQKFLNIHRNSNGFPTRIWDDDDDHAPRPPPPETQAAAADDPLPPTTTTTIMKLSHPLLRALDSCPPGSSPQFYQVLTQLLVSGLSDHPLAAGRAVKKLCSSPSSLPLAATLFSVLPNPDAFIANTILRSYLFSAAPDNALSFYRLRVLPAAVRPNHFTFPLLAKLFAELGLAQDGRTTHSCISKYGLESDQFVRNSLIHMYSSFGDVAAARQLFDLGGPECDLVAWNSMLNGLVKNGMVHDARKLFDDMPERDLVSWNVMIAGHAGAGEMEAANNLFFVMPERDVVSWNSLINGYARVGEAAPAREIFDVMPGRNLVSWNTMLALYARTKNYQECLKLFDGMMAVGSVKPNEATFTSVLTACANLGQLERGEWVHSLIRDGKGRIEPDVLLSTALLTMYAKCGAMESSREIFNQMAERSVVSWNSIISGYGLHGRGREALEVFLEMKRVGPRPNEKTFVCVLSACAHGGMVLEGWWCFDQMIYSYGIEPNLEHFGCMVDLLGRAGLLKSSEGIVKTMAVQRGATLWGALLSACRTHSEWELGEIVGRKLVEAEPGEVGPYVLLSNMYAAQGRWDEVEKVREMMRDNGLQKAAGVSLVGSDSDPPLAGGIGSGCRKSMVYSMLNEMGAHMKRGM